MIARYRDGAARAGRRRSAPWDADALRDGSSTLLDAYDITGALEAIWQPSAG